MKKIIILLVLLSSIACSTIPKISDKKINKTIILNNGFISYKLEYVLTIQKINPYFQGYLQYDYVVSKDVFNNFQINDNCKFKKNN